jgi:hypothetical protein
MDRYRIELNEVQSAVMAFPPLSSSGRALARSSPVCHPPARSVRGTHPPPGAALARSEESSTPLVIPRRCHPSAARRAGRPHVEGLKTFFASMDHYRIELNEVQSAVDGIPPPHCHPPAARRADRPMSKV